MLRSVSLCVLLVLIGTHASQTRSPEKTTLPAECTEIPTVAPTKTPETEYPTEEPTVAPTNTPVCGKTDKNAIIIFDETFQQGVKEYQQLCSLFDIQNTITIDEFAAGKYYETAAILVQEGDKSAAADAQNVIRYINEDYSRLDFDFLVSVYSNSVGKFLYNNKEIDEKNAAELATLYLSTMKDVANRTVNEDYPRSKVAALPMGYASFLLNQNLITVEQATEITTIYGDEWKYQCEKRGGSSKDPPVIWKEPKNPMEACEEFCKVESEVVEKFTEAFRKAVRASKYLSSLFNLSAKLTPLEFSRGVFYMSIYLLQSSGGDNTAIMADFISKYVRTCEKLERPLLVGVHANFMAKFLLSEKAINLENAEKYAGKYAEIMERLAYNIQNDEYPRSTVVAILFAWRDFLLHCRLLAADKAAKIAYYYGNEWFCQSSPSE